MWAMNGKPISGQGRKDLLGSVTMIQDIQGVMGEYNGTGNGLRGCETLA